MNAGAASFERDIAGELSAVAALLAESQAFVERCELSARVAYAVQLTLEELLTNGVKYGFGDGLPHRMAVRVRVGHPDVTIRVEDDGSPFDPTAVADPALPDDLAERQVGGLGLRLVRELTRELTYRRVGGRNVVEAKIPGR